MDERNAVRDSGDAPTRAEIRLPSQNLHADLSFYGDRLGFRLETIFPADDPAVAILTGHGLRIRLERGAEEPPGTIRLLCEHPGAFAGGETELTAPNGTRIEIRGHGPAFERPPTRHALVVQRLNESGSWIVGRAGMQYRDLIPGRLGGAVIASHIRIPEGGPVPDMVHYHTIAFQLIYCYRGWFDLVYEDQGPPFRLQAGDCVVQPPRIRHRVLESSDNAEVIELGAPAEHPTTIDHDLALPTGALSPERDFDGQRFCLHRRRGAAWGAWRIPGFEACRTGVDDATGGVANVRIARPVHVTGAAAGGDATRDATGGTIGDAARVTTETTTGATAGGATKDAAGGATETATSDTAGDATRDTTEATTGATADGATKATAAGAAEATAGVIASHGADILFTFVLEGAMRLQVSGRDAQELRAGDAFVIPPRVRAAYEPCSTDLELLEVSLPGTFETTLHERM